MLRRVALGETNAEIYLSPHTVRAYPQSASHMLGAGSRVEALLRASEFGLSEEPNPRLLVTSPSPRIPSRAPAARPLPPALPYPVRMFERLRRLLRSLVALLRRLILVALVAVTAGLLVLGLPRWPPELGW